MHRTVWLICSLLVSGCAYDPFDPYQRPGTWNPLGDNDANLRAMVVNPHDLAAGVGESTSAGAQAAPPVARLLAGKRYPLPAQNAALVDIVQPESQQQGTANPGAQ
jgi:hypothetical protein